MPINKNNGSKNGSRAGSRSSSQGGNQRGKQPSSGGGSRAGSQDSQRGKQVAQSPKPKAAPKAAAKTPSVSSRPASAEPRGAPAAVSSATAVRTSKAVAAAQPKDVCETMKTINSSGSASFDEFRNLFNCQYSKGIPMLMMFQALNDVSIQLCGKDDERCKGVLHSYVNSLGSGVKRAVADEQSLFTQLIMKLGSDKDFAEQQFDADFFTRLHKVTKDYIDDGEIDGLEITGNGSFYTTRAGSSAQDKAEDAATFMEKLLGSGKMISERNIRDLLSSTCTPSDEAVKLIKLLRKTKTVAHIQAFFDKEGRIPKAMEGFIVFRALTDHATYEGQGIGNGVYKFGKKSQLAAALEPILQGAEYAKTEGDSWTVRFSNISSLISALFKTEKNGKDIVRKVFPPQTALRAAALSIVLHYENRLATKIRAARKA